VPGEPGHILISIFCDPAQGHTLFLSQITMVEVVAAICRKAREQSIAEAERDQLISRFRRDVFSTDFPSIGHFDTFTTIHLLEHLTKAELPMALSHLLQVTTHRLIIAVPYEQEVQPLYGH
jgi:hypothetical protein